MSRDRKKKRPPLKPREESPEPRPDTSLLNLQEWIDDIVRPDGEYTLPAGHWQGGARWKVSEVYFRLAEGARIDGGDVGLWFWFGVHHVTMEGPAYDWAGEQQPKAVIQNARTYNLRTVECHHLTFRHLWCDRAGTTNLLTADSSDISVEHNWLTRAIREHALYFSQGGERLHALYNLLSGSARMGVQFNGNPKGQRDVKMIGNRCRGNGNAAGQFAFVKGGEVRGNESTGNRRDMVVWDDGAGRRGACSSLNFHDQPGKVNVDDRYSSGIRHRGLLWNGREWVRGFG